MNTTFKLGKVNIPVPGSETPIVIEGLEVKVENYNLLEGLKVAKEIPAILAELKAVMEEDYMPEPFGFMDDEDEDFEEDELPEGVPSFFDFLAQKAAQQQEAPQGMPKSLADLLASQGEGNPFTGGQPKSLADLLGQAKPKSLADILAEDGHMPKGPIGIKIHGGDIGGLLNFLQDNSKK
jgi:hypothetical protein